MADEANDIFSEPGSTVVDDEAAYAAAMAMSGTESTPPPDDGGDGGTAAAKQEEAAETATQQEGKAAAEGEEKPPKGYVRHEALSEARHINSELRDALLATQSKLAQVESLREELREWKASQNKQSDAERAAAEQEAYDNDPVGFMKSKTDAMEAELRKLRDEGKLTEEQQQQALEQQRQMAALTMQIATQVNEFKQTTPDYEDAFNFLFEARLKEYAALGITNPAQVNQTFSQESYALAQAAMANKRNPGEAVYALAQARGYVKKDTTAATDEATQSGKNDTLTQQLDKLENGQKAAQTLSGGGARNKGEVTLSDIEQMSEAEEDAFFEAMARAEGGGSIFDE